MKKLPSRGREAVSAYFMDRQFIKNNAEAIRKAALPPGSIMVWNPKRTRGSPRTSCPRGSFR